MSTEANKNVVRRFNMEFISTGNRSAFKELLAADIVDHDGHRVDAQGVRPSPTWRSKSTTRSPRTTRS